MEKTPELRTVENARNEITKMRENAAKRADFKNKWSPSPGKHKIKFLSELTYGNLDTSGEFPKQWMFVKILVGGLEKIWHMIQSKSSLSSTYFQLVCLMDKNSNRLTDLETEVIVKNDGKGFNDYTIPDALSGVSEA